VSDAGLPVIRGELQHAIARLRGTPYTCTIRVGRMTLLRGGLFTKPVPGWYIGAAEDGTTRIHFAIGSDLHLYPGGRVDGRGQFTTPGEWDYADTAAYRAIDEQLVALLRGAALPRPAT
jgi:hypothetical protein